MHIDDRRLGFHRYGRALLAVGLVLSAACRADSFSAPQSTDCAGQTVCPLASTPIDAAVYTSLTDAMVRLVPWIGDAPTQSALAGSLRALEAGLQTGRSADARIALAQVYVILAPLRFTANDGATFDLPDVAALRLSLVPAANALGVQAP